MLYFRSRFFFFPLLWRRGGDSSSFPPRYRTVCEKRLSLLAWGKKYPLALLRRDAHMPAHVRKHHTRKALAATYLDLASAPITSDASPPPPGDPGGSRRRQILHIASAFAGGGQRRQQLESREKLLRRRSNRISSLNTLSFSLDRRCNNLALRRKVPYYRK